MYSVRTQNLRIKSDRPPWLLHSVHCPPGPPIGQVISPCAPTVLASLATAYYLIGPWVPIGHLGDRLSSYWSSDLSVGSYWSPFYTAYSLIGQVISPWAPIGPLGYSLSFYWSSVLSVGSYWPSWIYSLISYWSSDLSVGSYWPPRLYSLITYMNMYCRSSDLSVGSYWPLCLQLILLLVK